MPHPGSLVNTLALTLALSFPAASVLAQPASFSFQNNDRVVFLGDGLIEQAQYSGWIETALTASASDKTLTFRNLGWNGDTPAGDSRFGLSLVQAGHAPADEGWKQLQAQLELTQPNVLIIGYGMASSLEGGPDGIAKFISDYKRLLETARKISPDVRFVLLSPLNRTDKVPHAQTLVAYSEAIQKLAAQQDATFIDLSGAANDSKLRQDPIHLNSDGYRQIANVIDKSLTGGEANWQESPNTDALRQTILRKNTWWFHRSRPANMAYVFGFRKREQGQNAVEIPRFDKLIEKEEELIAQLSLLQNAAIQMPPKQTESQYAEFQAQPTPEFTIADDWEVTLWAENPQLNKPIHMNFDPQGRLWVASSEAYPMIEVGQSAPDKILVLEDTNGDGKADKSTTFADGLLIPTGIAPGDGGVYVAQSTDLLFLEDTDNDGKADRRTRTLSGFGTEDTHHNLHTLQWGVDGRLYMNQSVYTRTDTETPHGVVRLKAGGGFMLDTDRKQMNILFRGLWNAWGHQFDAYGQSFLTDGAGFQGIAWAFPGAAFNPIPRGRRVLDLISPGSYPKFASGEIVYGPSFPADWQGSMVTCDFRANRVTRFDIASQDAGFVTSQAPDLLRTSASTFRPIDIKQGPDGALYIADWSNPIINHGEVDFRDPRRDRWHGRIWRMRWKGAPEAKPRVDLAQLSTPVLLDNLLSEDRYVRDQSRRVLSERETSDISAALTTWLTTQESPEAKLQALWLRQTHRSVDRELLDELLAAEDPRIQAAAVRVLADWSLPSGSDAPLLGSDDNPLDRFRPLVAAAHPRVRLEAIRGLAGFESAAASLLALKGLEHPMDRFLQFALAQLVDDNSQPIMNAIESQEWSTEGSQAAARLEFVLTNIAPAQAENFLQSYLAANPMPSDGSGPWIELIGSAGGPAQLDKLLTQTAEGGFNSGATVRALTALTSAQRLKKRRPSKNLGRIGSLLKSKDPVVQKAAISLAGAWRLKGQIPPIAAFAAADSQETGLRLEAIAALQSIGEGEGIAKLAELTESTTGEVQTAAILSLAALAPQQAAPLFFSQLSETEDEAAATALWRRALSSQEAGKILAQAIPQDGLPEHALRAGVRAAQQSGRPEEALLAVLEPRIGQAMTAAEWSPKQIAALIEKVQTKGDPHRGEAIYWREKLQCVNCHAIGGVGGRVGPDMTSLGASAPADYIVESLFAPDAKIKEGFHSIVVATEDGLVVTGVKVENTGEELVLRDATNKLVRIPTADIIAKQAGRSLMPVGVVDRLSAEEQIDLIRFLTELGKPGRFDSSRGGVARVTEVLAGTHRVEQEGIQRILDGAPGLKWQPVLTRVDGTLTAAQLKAATVHPSRMSLIHAYIRTEMSVSEPGIAKFTIAGATHVTAWIDGVEIPQLANPEGSKEKNIQFEKDLSGGTHTLLLRLDARELPETLQIRSSDVTFAVE
ncbi:hypothetical protein FF011L_39410 [Roseimaritima multifibrata]|uniref:Cytochrome c domain-containing protein n=1 Tax=Roseimaritima multifibrata TaxID=1930274 RepID=A0A517MJV8_9BACT|nr:PVC-type heme-binding CxxCH protein [Roseimaritima multifibrata]QDS95154.1 hypothetical protein FF011L_39410 [Roseimaritima multifibrata]